MQGTRCGPYLIQRELGSGGMGVVYEAVPSAAPDAGGERVAIKVVHAQLLEEPGMRERFAREVEIGRRIVHPNVVRTIDSGEWDGNPYAVLEFVEGQTLEQLQQELGRVPEELCRHIGRHVAAGLVAVHAQGIVHRDIKPGNVLITPAHDIKLMDMGLARGSLGEDRVSQTGMFVGTFAYAPPEQFKGAKELDPRGDLYAVGALLYDLATGQPPFAADSPQALLRLVLDERPRRPGQLNPQLSPFLEELLLVLLDKDPEQRLDSAKRLVSVLEAGEAGEWWTRRVTILQAETRRPLRRYRIPRETECAGRESELDALRVAYAHAQGGDGRVVLLEGEAGIGKSRIVDELMRRLETDGEDVNFLFGSYPPGGGATVAGAFAAAYREQLGSGGSAPYLAETPALVPPFDAFLRGDATPTGSEPLTLDTLKTVFVHATRALARERVTVVVIDDLHFAPSEGRGLFASLAAALPGHRILLIGTARAGLPREWTADLERLEHVQRSEVRRLEIGDVRRLLRGVMGSSLRAERLADSVARTADGNPFFAFEIVRALREVGVITRGEDGAWVTSADVTAIEIPDTVNGLLAARLAHLERDERELLDCAACCGFDFDGGLVAEALGLRRLAALRAFGRIEQDHGLVRARGPGFVFDHHAILEHVAAAIPRAVRLELHAALGETLEARVDGKNVDPAELDGEVAVDLCWHFLRGGSVRAALRYLDAGLTDLEQLYAHDRALALIDQVLSTPALVDGAERLLLLLRKQDILDVCGTFDERSTVVDEAVRCLEGGLDDPELHARVLLAQARLLRGTWSSEDATQTTERALAYACWSGSLELQAIAHRELAGEYRTLENFPRAKLHGVQSIKLARGLGDTANEAEATVALGFCERVLATPELARAQFERGLQLAREAGDPRAEFSALMALARCRRVERDCPPTNALVDRALDLARRMGDRPREAEALTEVAALAKEAGDYDRVHDATLRCAELWRETGNPRMEFRSADLLADHLSAAGNLDEALRWAKRSVRIQSNADHAHHRLERLHALLVDRGECEAQIREFSEHHARAVEHQNTWDELVDVGALSHLHWQLGHVDQAVEFARLRVSRARDVDDEHITGDALLCLASFLRVVGEADEARAVIRESARVASTVHDHESEARALGLYADLSADEGEMVAAIGECEQSSRCRHVREASLRICRIASSMGRTVQARSLAAWCTTPCSGTTRSQRLLAHAWLVLLPEDDGAEPANKDLWILWHDHHGADRPPTSDEARERALATLAEEADRTSVAARMEARLLLWRATGDDSHLVESYRLLQFLIAHAPEGCRAAMSKSTVLHREIVAAWESRSAR